MTVVLPSHLFTLTPLERRVVTLGICPSCHTRTLKENPRVDPARGLSQCERCSKVYVLNPD
jgi:hypothetical protein